MTPLLSAVFVASLAGSLHCAGMCGGLVVFYAGADASPGWRRLVTHGTYNGGRLVGYAVLGAAAGAFGGAVNVAGSMAGFQRLAMPCAGAVMILWGVGALLRIKGVRLFAHSTRNNRLADLTRRAFSRIAHRPPVVRALFVGLLSAILPCGWLWAFIITAAGTAKPATGALVMTVFWVGTVPILFAIGLGAQAAVLPLRRHAPTLTAILLVVIGVVAIVRRPETSSAILPKIADKAITTVEQVEELDAETMPCCEDE